MNHTYFISSVPHTSAHGAGTPPLHMHLGFVHVSSWVESEGDFPFVYICLINIILKTRKKEHLFRKET